MDERIRSRLARDTEANVKFGYLIAFALCVLTIRTAFKSHLPLAVGLGCLAAFIGILALLSPTSLSKARNLWLKLGGGLGKINAFVILSILFIFVFVPISLFLRLTGKDKLAMRNFRTRTSLFTPSEKRASADLERMF